MSFHGGFTDLSGLLEACVSGRKIIDEVRRVNVVAGQVRGDGVQSRTPASRESNLNDWTIDSWQHCTPSLGIEVVLGRSVSASNEPAQRSSCRCHHVAVRPFCHGALTSMM